MTYSIILSWTAKNHLKTLSRQLHIFRVEENSKTFQDLHRNLTTFRGKMEFKDFSTTFLKIQGLFKTV